MEKKELRIVFMGTPEFAVESLRALVENGYNVVGVITMPDKAVGRSHSTFQYSAVKNYALEQNLPLLQPEKLKDESFLADLQAWQADLQIVVAFRMLPEVVWNMPPMGTFNLHGSLLPQYRGAAPINWAIINGEKETGATTFFLTHEIDTGRIIRQENVTIGEHDNVGKIYDELMHIGGKLVCETVDLILEGKAVGIPQNEFYKNESELKHAPKIFKETCRIDWSGEVWAVFNHIRGLSPYPCAWTELNMEGKEPQTAKIYAADYLLTETQHPRGSIDTDNKTYLRIACVGGLIDVKEIQMAGKKAMKIDELLRGYKFEAGSCFK